MIPSVGSMIHENLQWMHDLFPKKDVVNIRETDTKKGLNIKVGELSRSIMDYHRLPWDAPFTLGMLLSPLGCSFHPWNAPFTLGMLPYHARQRLRSEERLPEKGERNWGKRIVLVKGYKPRVVVWETWDSHLGVFFSIASPHFHLENWGKMKPFLTNPFQPR